jgi:acetyltransferase-like isoleucine patch superfamily enzyme
MMATLKLEHDWFSRPVPDNVCLGARSWLHSSFAFAHYRSRAAIGVRVGSDTGLYAGTFFDLGPEAEIEIGNYCSIVGAIFATNGRVVVGDFALIAHEVVLADRHWPTPGHYPPSAEWPRASEQPVSSIEIGANVWIGTQAIILGNVRVGEGAIIGAGTLVTQDVPPFTLCAGNPMRIVRTISKGESGRL